MNKIPEKFKLKENHPTMVKFNKLCDFAEELGLSFYAERTCLVLSDRDSGLPDLEIKDLENSDSCPTFPPTFEFKIIYDNPEYIKFQKEQREEDCKKREEQKRLEKLKQEEELRIRKEKEAKQIEDNEKKQLAILKAKYENA